MPAAKYFDKATLLLHVNQLFLLLPFPTTTDIEVSFVSVKYCHLPDDSLICLKHVTVDS